MTRAVFNNVRMSGMLTVVPSGRIKLDDEIRFYENNQVKLERLKTTVGLSERAVADENTTPGDMMFFAAKNLIEGMGIDVNTIDAVICVTDMPDYKCPPTACVIHGRLGLPVKCMAFDINQGCAGYVYGLYVAHAMIESGGCNRILLLVGDAKTHTIDVRDRVSAPIFGDGAAATIVERASNCVPAYFSIGADGEKFENIMIPAGGARNPYTVDSMVAVPDEYGNIRAPVNFRMNGRAVFDFTMNVVPGNISDCISFAGISVDDIDYFVLHQANKSIIENIVRRLGVSDMARVPTQTLGKIGNLAVASIPSAICDVLCEVVSGETKRVLLSGFGVGLSFATAVVELGNIYCSHILEYKGENK